MPDATQARSLNYRFTMRVLAEDQCFQKESFYINLSAILCFLLLEISVDAGGADISGV